MKKIIIHRKRDKQLCVCPDCKALHWLYLDELLGKRKFDCTKCNKKVDIKKVKIISPVINFLPIILKYYNEGEAEVEICCEVGNFENDMQKLLSLIKGPNMGWEVKDKTTKEIRLKLCPNCGKCPHCKKIVKLTEVEDYRVCSECKSRDVTLLNVTGKECPVCTNKKLREGKKKIVTVIVSIEQIRKLELPR